VNRSTPVACGPNVDHDQGEHRSDQGQVDLDTLSVELVAVVDQTIQPTTASLWLRHESLPLPAGRYPKMTVRGRCRRRLAVQTPGRRSAILDGDERPSPTLRTEAEPKWIGTASSADSPSSSARPPSGGPGSGATRSVRPAGPPCPSSPPPARGVSVEA
jgi:hypothetical protein